MEDIEILSQLLQKKYKEALDVREHYTLCSGTNRLPINDFVTVINKASLLEIYFNYIDELDSMHINYVLVSVFNSQMEYPKKKTTKVANMRILSNTIRVVDRYSAEDEDKSYFDDDACTYLYNSKIKTFKENKKELSYEEIKELVETAVFTIKNLVFDRYTGKFILKSDKKDREKEIKAYKNIFNNETIKLDIGECLVCMEDTQTKTHCCSKNLCNYCWDKIKPRIEDEDYNMSILPCPNCRRDLREDEQVR